MKAETGKIDCFFNKRSDDVINNAWDELCDYMGENKINTPLTLVEFETIFSKLNKNDKYTVWKEDILHSFRYDSYSWPIVERDPK